jgi:hypothetical protein
MQRPTVKNAPKAPIAARWGPRLAEDKRKSSPALDEIGNSASKFARKLLSRWYVVQSCSYANFRFPF